MTNKTERFLVMSEAEFEAALDRTQRLFCDGEWGWDFNHAELETALAACRAREVQQKTVFGCETKEWVEVEK